MIVKKVRTSRMYIQGEHVFAATSKNKPTLRGSVVELPIEP